MKNIFIILLLSCLVQPGYGQQANAQIDNEYFLLGSLLDYMGREKYKGNVAWVGSYYKSEKSLASFIDSVFSGSYPDLNSATAKDFRSVGLYSEGLSKKIDEYYTFIPSRGVSNSDTIDFEKMKPEDFTEDFYRKNFDTLYTGSIRSDIFENDLQKLSFLTGAYIRFGQSNNSTISFRIFNSEKKARLCIDLLREVNCTDVGYKFINNIPAGHIISFTPTAELKGYFDAYRHLKAASN